jgi:hypothetical protein
MSFWKWLMQLSFNVRGHPKPVYVATPPSAALDVGTSVTVTVSRNGTAATITGVSSPDPRFTVVAGSPGAFVVTFVGPADPVNDIVADLVIQVA